MILTGYLLSGLIAVGIVFIGARFLWDPATASRDYGIPNPDRQPILRDIVRVHLLRGGEQ